ncbi:aminoglycoside phosphotransferase family protein [Streptomyces liangshanensis]|uniref:aminoglycoside phosphotransferase family protein n=1 Tax=Streptomyces liangshanensis TaxID=2717324 RepID=UPI0036DAAF2F
MSRIGGDTLRGTDVGPAVTRCLARALKTLHTAVPGAVLAGLPEAPWGAAYVDGRVRAWAAGGVDAAWGREIVRAFEAGREWLAAVPLESVSGPGAVVPVFGLSDGNLANYLYDGERVRLLDFEDSGRTDRALELADIAGHPSTWVDSCFDVPLFLDQFDLGAPERARLAHLRRLLALHWLGVLVADRGASRRNPPGAACRQARRVLALLVQADRTP